MHDFAGVFVALYAAHEVADHWVQREREAVTKGAVGWRGRLACASHVVWYTVTALVALVALVWRFGVDLSPARIAVGLVVSAVTHYVADRRAPLGWVAARVGKSGFWMLGDPVAAPAGTGAYVMDQSWHVAWLFVAALIIA